MLLDSNYESICVPIARFKLKSWYECIPVKSRLEWGFVPSSWVAKFCAPCNVDAQRSDGDFARATVPNLMNLSVASAPVCMVYNHCFVMLLAIAMKNLPEVRE